MSADPADEGVPLARRRPQQLLLSFLGAQVLDHDVPPIGSRIFLQLLDGLDVAEAAGRATLARMTRKGLLERRQEGRTARYALSAMGEETLRSAKGRVESTTPFTHPAGGWTLLSYSMPESRRDLRHQIRARLIWAGFGGLRDGLWIAPGQVDVSQLLAGPVFAGGSAEAFFAQPAPGIDVGSLMHRAWDLTAIRAEHDRFLARWERIPDQAVGGASMSQLTLLGADWLQLLRTDPGLPAEHLPPDWPAARSAAAYAQWFAALHPPADEWLRRLVVTDALRR